MENNRKPKTINTKKRKSLYISNKAISEVAVDLASNGWVLKAPKVNSPSNDRISTLRREKELHIFKK